jgi:prephenate dehydrogenase
VTAPVERLAVIGLGLLGGSGALAARTRGAARRVVGATRRADVLQEALRRGALDEAASPEQAARGADLVVLATPLAAMGPALRTIAPVLSRGCVVTDVGSVKGTLADTLPGLLGRDAHYVGSHPMAGSHARGFAHARADLFEGAPCIVLSSGPAAPRERVAAFWTALGARVTLREAARHDAEVAWVSHLPHLLAFAFAAAYRDAPPGAAEVQGAGFRDFTRIAHSDPELWAEILTANRKAIGAPLQVVERALASLARAIEADDADAVERLLTAARSALAPGGGRDPADANAPELPTVSEPGGTSRRRRR